MMTARYRLVGTSIATGMLLLLGACSSTATTTTTTSATTSTGSNAPFVIGHMWTANPAVGAIGDYYNGFRSYFDFLNASGGVDGKKVQIDAIDDQLTAQGTLSAYNTLYNNPSVLTITGQDISSDAAIAVTKSQQDGMVVALGGATYSASILPLKPTVFEFAEIFRDSLATMAIYAKSKGLKKVALFYFDAAEAHVAVAPAAIALKAAGLDVVTTQFLPVTGTTDFSSEAIAAKAAGAQVIFALEGPSGYIAIATSMKATGVDIPVLASSAGLAAPVFAAFKAAGIEYLSESPWFPLTDEPGYAQMAAAAKKYANVDAPSANVVGGWIGGEIIAAALKQCGPSCTRQSFRAALQSVKNLTTGGLSGPVSFSATSHYAPTEDQFFTISADGTVSAVTGLIPIAANRP